MGQVTNSWENGMLCRGQNGDSKIVDEREKSGTNRRNKKMLDRRNKKVGREGDERNNLST